MSLQTFVSQGHLVSEHRFKSDVPDTLARKQIAEPGRWDDVQLLPPNVMIHRTCTLDLGGLTLELHHLPGHTDDCLIAYLPEHGIGLMGDTIETPFPVVPRDSNLAAWIEPLERWEQVPKLTRVVPLFSKTCCRGWKCTAIDAEQLLNVW
jgi:glyoxylase-like metal-dependent hydrolase (beta-lactamase superfamily II)